MGDKQSKSLTEIGLKYVYKYLILHFSLLLIILLISTALSLNQQNLLTLSASKFLFVIAIFFLFILVFIFLILGLANIVNGRREFSDQHESNVLSATTLIIIYLIIYFINLTIAEGFTGGTAFLAAASSGFSLSVFPQFYLVMTLSIISHLLLGFSLIYLVKKLITKGQMMQLKLTYILLVLGTFTINITALIAYLLFYKIFKDVYLNINQGNLKPALVAPCPKCSCEIPIEARICMFCGVKFEKTISDQLDPRLNFDVPESDYKLKHGYYPTQRLTKEEKRKFFYFIGLIIISIIVGLVLILFI